MTDRWIALGVVARPHGVRGELRVRLHDPGSDLLFHVEEVDVEGKGRFHVRGARPERDAVLLRLAGCETRDDADRLRGLAVRVPRSALPPLAEGEYYLCDLVGLRVEDPEGAVRGRVHAATEGPGHAILQVTLESGGEPIDVPLADTWVVAVDVSAGKVVVRGLDELAGALRD